MEQIVKIYTVRLEWLRRRLPQIVSCLNRLNSSRIGSSRRGQWMPSGVNGDAIEKAGEESDAWLVTVTLRKPSKGARMIYAFDDVGKVLKDLAVAHGKYVAIRSLEAPK